MRVMCSFGSKHISYDHLFGRTLTGLSLPSDIDIMFVPYDGRDGCLAQFDQLGGTLSCRRGLRPVLCDLACLRTHRDGRGVGSESGMGTSSGVVVGTSVMNGGIMVVSSIVAAKDDVGRRTRRLNGCKIRIIKIIYLTGAIGCPRGVRV